MIMHPDHKEDEFMDAISLVTSMASILASALGWPERDARRYTRLVYVDREVRLLLETESSQVGEIVAKGVIEIMKERMKHLRDREWRAIELSQRSVSRPLTERERDFVIDVNEEIERRERDFKRLAQGGD
jgi:hypothetical protein